MSEQNKFRIMNSSLEFNGSAEEKCHKKEKTIKQHNSGKYKEWIKRVNDCFEESKECNNNLCNSYNVNNNNRPHVVREVIELKVHSLVKKNDERKSVWTEKGNACLDSNRWTHDMYNEDEQKPVTTEELIDRYGYDIRSSNRPPPLRATDIRSSNRPPPLRATRSQRRRQRRKKQRNLINDQEQHHVNIVTKSLPYKTDVQDSFTLQSSSSKRRYPNHMGNSGLQVKDEEDVQRKLNSIMGNASKLMSHTIQVVETHITEVRSRAEGVLEELQQDTVRQLKRALEGAERKAVGLVREEWKAKRETSSCTETTSTVDHDHQVD